LRLYGIGRDIVAALAICASKPPDRLTKEGVEKDVVVWKRKSREFAEEVGWEGKEDKFWQGRNST
jgi:hypothetical protein